MWAQQIALICVSVLCFPVSFSFRLVFSLYFNINQQQMEKLIISDNY